LKIDNRAGRRPFSDGGRCGHSLTVLWSNSRVDARHPPHPVDVIKHTGVTMNSRDGALSLRRYAGSPLARAPAGLAVVLATLIGAPGAASAQNAQQAADSGLEEVIVTATRREENIRDVPISISAFSEAQMDIQGIRAVDDIARLAPGIQFNRSSGFGSDLGNSISIRGVSSAAGQATTGVYIDDTPIQVGATVASGNFADNAYPRLFDIQRVEVLRGPQGTLFGSGSEGGTLRFITPPPSLTQSSAHVRSEVSSTQYGAPSYEFGAAGGAPIIQDTLGFRASVWNRRDGGYVDSVDYYTGQVTQRDNNWTDSTSARVALAWSPIENLTITPSVFYQKIKANGAGAFYLPSDGLTGPLTPGGPNLPVFQQPYGNVGDGDYVDIHQTPQWATQRLVLSALKMEYGFARMDLLSNTSYYERKQHDQTDYSFIHGGNFSARYFPNPAWDVVGNEDQGNRYFTQEVRLQSSDPEARLKWLVGVFYSDTSTYGNLAVANPHLGEMLALGPLGNGCSPAQCILNRFGRPLVDGIYSFIGNTQVDETQKAAFGQIDYLLTEHLTATVGVRYAKLTNEFVNVSGGASSGAAWPTFKRGDAESNATTPKYMLSYKTDGGSLIYGSATKGFRNGGSNAPVSAAACQASLQQLGLSEFPLTYDPDSVWSYELGSKFALAGGRLQVDASVFQIDWEDQIRNVFLPTCILQFTTNVGSTQSRGFDLAVQWRALDSLLLSLNGGYQEVKAKETITSGSLNIVTKDDYLQGSQPTANAAAQYTFNVWEKASYLRADVSYTGKTKRGAAFNPLNAGYNVNQLFENPSYTLTNLRLGAELGDWDVSLFVNNLFNEQPILNENRGMLTFSSIPSGLLSATTLRPRTAGVTATLRF
jgi:iron complex outermembrane recepter protein